MAYVRTKPGNEKVIKKTISLSPETLEKLTHLCKSMHMNRSQYITYVIDFQSAMMGSKKMNKAVEGLIRHLLAEKL